MDVYAFGIGTDFRGRLFPGSQRLLELADAVAALQVEVLCWCGRRGQLNARVVGGRVVREGDTVLVADTAPATPPRCATRCCAGRTTAAGDLGPGTRCGPADPG